MKLFSFVQDGAQRVGGLSERGGVDLTALGFPASMNAVIEGGDAMLRELEKALGNNALAPYRADFTYGNVTEPKKIICAGLNYKQHAEETGEALPKYPLFFSKFNDALTPAGVPVKLPEWLKKYDYEAELVIVVGKAGYNLPLEEAGAHIFGYTCGNDLSARDAQFLSSQWLSGKALPGFAPNGPFVVTRDCFDPEKPHGIICRLNGVPVQNGNTPDMIFTCNELLSAASRYFPLSPGDLIFTGTPPGVIQGKPRAERVWLKAGDVVTVSIEGVGELTTPLQ